MLRARVPVDACLSGPPGKHWVPFWAVHTDFVKVTLSAVQEGDCSASGRGESAVSNRGAGAKGKKSQDVVSEGQQKGEAGTRMSFLKTIGAATSPPPPPAKTQ